MVDSNPVPVTAHHAPAFEGILRHLQDAWNAGDGAAFGAPMAEDADFVTIRADHLKGRNAIVASHRHIFSSFYAGSRNELTLESARMIDERVALVHARSALQAPTGPLAGRHEARLSLVLVSLGRGWEITSFHITLATTA